LGNYILRHFLKITEVARILGYFFLGKNYVLFLTKNVLVYILGESFINSSGHPGAKPNRSIVNYVCSVNDPLTNKCWLNRKNSAEVICL
jgi:hypothetical protein